MCLHFPHGLSGGLSANISGYKVFLLWRAKAVLLFLFEMDKCFIDLVINNSDAMEKFYAHKVPSAI